MPVTYNDEYRLHGILPINSNDEVQLRKRFYISAIARFGMDAV